MNERIRELAAEAKMSTYLLAYGLEFNISIEKFAELIVRECAHVINQENAKCYQVSQPFSIEQVLTKHFGVE